MNIVLIFPVTNTSENIPTILTEFKNNLAPKLKILGAEKIEIKFAGTGYVFVGTNQTLEGQPKGQGILEQLKNCVYSPNYVIMCDGSGAIPYNNIIQIFQELVSDPRMCCVLASRGENKAISEERFLIEEFEIFTLKKYHNHKRDILDGQCGLWGYKTGILNIDGIQKEIILTANSYEIELDLLGEILEKELEYSFIDINLPPRTSKSSFIYKNNLGKMKFLLAKYKKLKDCISNYVIEFEKQKQDKILKEGIKDTWENYKENLFKLIR